MDIVLIPGFMLDGDLWREMRPELEAFGRIVDVDMSRDATIRGMAARALADVREPVFVIGFSMGGYVAREMVYQAPERVGALALIATSSKGAEQVPLRAPIDPARFRRISRTSALRALHPEHRSDELVDRIQTMSQRLGGIVFQQQSAEPRVDDTERLGSITCPTVVVAAAQDELRTVAESEVLHAGIQSSNLVVIERSGHMIPMEQPEELLRSLRPLLETAASNGGGSAEPSAKR